MKTGVLLAALALLLPVMSAIAQDKSDPKQDKADPKAQAKETEAQAKEALKHPETLKDKAPDTFQVKFETTQGDFVLDVTREWSPNGADRFYNLVKHGFYNGVKFFRVIPNFMVQFGIHGDPDIASKWQRATIPDDKVVESNKRGYITFAKTGAPDSRTTQLFINFQDNARLDAMQFAPFGKVSKGMDVVDKLYSGYGGEPSSHQGEIVQGGNKYLEDNWPKLDSIKKATLVK